MKYAEIDFDLCLKDTGLAILLEIDGRPVWIPHSLIDPDEIPEVDDGPASTFVAVFFAEKQGLV